MTPWPPQLALGCIGDRGRGKASTGGLTRMSLRQRGPQGSCSGAEGEGEVEGGQPVGSPAATSQARAGPAASAVGLGR